MTAIISACGRYRYRLDRAWGKGSAVAFIGVNPSTADATEDDATIRKMRGFAQRNGHGRMIVVNLFAYRATDVRDLSRCADPYGVDCDHELRRAINEAVRVVPCWGSLDKLPVHLRQRAGNVSVIVHSAGRQTDCFGLTKNGDPKHPLMLGYNTPLVSYWSARA